MPMPGGMQSASAMDLGLNTLKSKANETEAEKLRRKKLQEQMQQQRPMMPFSGAVMSLNGNQY